MFFLLALEKIFFLKRIRGTIFIFSNIIKAIKFSMKKQNKVIVVAFGGRSPEHEVSVITGFQAMDVLEKMRYHVLPLYMTKAGHWLSGKGLKLLSCYQDDQAIHRNGIPAILGVNPYGQATITLKSKTRFSKDNVYLIKVMVVAFHGSEGENGGFQGLCELFNIPYTSSGPFSSFLAMSKYETKRWCTWHGLSVIPSVKVFLSQWQQHPKETIQEIITKISFPIIVKPAGLGSSIGIGIAHDKDELAVQIEEAFSYDDYVLLEHKISPLMEVNCSVLGSPGSYRVSVCESPFSHSGLLNFSDKYEHGNEFYKGMAALPRQIPAPISKENVMKIEQLAKKAARVFRLYGVTRIDFLYDLAKEEVFINELNTVPGSLAYYLWKASGMGFEELMEELLTIALTRHAHKQTKIRHFDTNLLKERVKGDIKGLKSHNTL